MTIAQYLRLLREQWLAVLLLTVLGALGAGTFSFLQTPQYESETQLFVSATAQPGEVAEWVQTSTFTQQRVKSYTDLLTSPKVLDPVIEELRLDTTADELANRITATSPLDTVLIDVAVTDASPARAADIANAIATQFPTLVNKLETPAGQTTSPVKVSITRPAIASSHPVSPRTSLNLALGLLVGLGLGVGAAVLRDSLDRTIGGRHQASDIASAPVLGAVSDDPQVSQTPLISQDAFSPRAEAFRQLRTNIRFLSVDHRVSSLVVTGSVPSEGKTTTAANIAIALAQNGERVVLIDADLRRPTVADLFGVPSGVGLTTVLLGDTSVDTALQRWRDDLPLFVLCAGPLPPNPSELIGSARMAELVHDLTRNGMTVVVDSPPLLPVTDAAILARVTDGALVVTRVGSTKVDQFSTAIESLRTAGAPILGVVLNRVPKRGRGGGYYGGYEARYSSYAPDRTASVSSASAADPYSLPSPGAATAAPTGDPTLVGTAPAGAAPSAYTLFPPPGRAPAGHGTELSGGVAAWGAPGEAQRRPEVAPAGSLDAVLHPTAPPTLLSPLPAGGAGSADFVDVRHGVGGAPPTGRVFGTNGTPPAFVEGANGHVQIDRTSAAVNGHAGGGVNGSVNGYVPGQPTPYQPAPARSRGRRSAAPPER